MKRVILLVASTMFSLSLFAQTVNNVPLSEINTEYVQIVGMSKMLSTKLNINIDFGQETNFFKGGQECLIKDENDNKMVFNSMIDALNFMSKNGYEYVDAYTVTVSNQNIYHYLLKKRKE